MQFKIENMSCAGCAGSVTATVKAQDSAAIVDIDVASKIVKIESTKIEAILAALDADGFPAQAL